MKKVIIFCCTMLLTQVVYASEYYLNKEPYVHPAIIRDLETWISDTGDQVLSINLNDAQGSNRYYGDIKATDGSVCYDVDSDGREWFCYRSVGILDNEIFVILTVESSGGSGRFTNLSLLVFEEKYNFSYDEKEHKLSQNKKMNVLSRLGGIALGDRFSPEELKVDGDKIYVGKDVGWFSVSGGTGGDDNFTKSEGVVIDVDFAENEKEKK